MNVCALLDTSSAQIIVSLDTTMRQVARLLRRHDLDWLVVVTRFGRPVGVVGCESVLRAMKEQLTATHRTVPWESHTVGRYLETELVTIPHSSDVVEANKQLVNSGARFGVVLSGGQPMGVVSERKTAMAAQRKLRAERAAS